MDDYLENLVSVERLSNARRPQAQPVDQLLEDSLAKVQKYLATPVEEDVLVEDASKAHRQWLMRTWNEYFNKRKVNPDTIWCGLCLGDPLATAWSKAFLSDRVENSVRRVMVIGSEEYEERRMLNSASSVLAAWRALIKEANLTVLHEKRLRESNPGDKWRLRFHNYNAKPPSSSIGVFEISKWVWSDLAAEHGLSKEITFEKLEATAEDVIIILRTLWERAAELGIDVQTRIAFHANVLLSAMGGFRPGTLGKVRYRDVLVSVLRDPMDNTKLKHTATVTIPRNKLKNSLRVKNKSIKFSAFFVPFPPVCLSRLIVARAIQDGAFDAGYANAEEFLNRPVLGNVDYIPLPWKKEVLDDFVFRLSYQQFNDIWYRVCIAAGFRQVPRLYSLRVGAGSRLDKDPLFSSALRNWVMSHTNTMFEAQYQTSRLREDLLQAAFGQRTGCDNTHLFAFLRNMSISRDQNAPIDLNPDDWAEFDNRKDVLKLEEAIGKVQVAKNQASSNNDKEEMATLTELFRLLRSRHRYLRHAWGKLRLVELRNKYFGEADRARALGKEPPKVATIVSNQTAGIRALKSNAQIAGQIIQHVDRKWNVSSDDDDQGRYIDLLVAYGKGCSKADLDLWEDEYTNTEDNEDDATDEDDDYCEKEENNKDHIGAGGGEDETWRCIICDLNFSSRKTLTSHFEKHKRAQYFNIKKPRRCPQCRKDNNKKKKEDCLVESGLLAWFNHLERFHGPYSLPYASADLKDPAKFPCPFSICNSKGKHKLFNSRGLTGHLSKAHAAEMDDKKKDKFKTEVRCGQCCSCKRCTSQGVGHGVLVNSISEWKRHFDMFHADEKRALYRCFICQEATRTPGGLKSHFWNLHEKREGYFERPFSCPQCVRGGNIDSPSIMGRKAWQEHVDKCHNGGAMEHKSNEIIESPDTTSHYPCLVCGRCYHGRAVLQEHLYLKHKQVFETIPFQCPQCMRQFDNINAWIHHTTREHERSERSKACTVGSHNKGASVPTVPTSERGYMDQIKQSDEESVTDMGLIYEDRPGGGEGAIGCGDVEGPEPRSSSSFGASCKNNKRKKTGDDITSSIGSELRPHQRLRYSISASAVGTKPELVDDEVPIDPELMKLSGLVAMECSA